MAISRNIKKSNAPETTRTPEVRTHGSLVKSSPLDIRLGEARGRGLRVIAMAKISVTVQKMTGEEKVIEADPQETRDGTVGWGHCGDVAVADFVRASRWGCNSSCKML